MSFETILRRTQEIAFVGRSLVGRPTMEEVRVVLPDPDSPEPAFIRAVSWLYCLYFEAGRVSFGFLPRLGEAYSLVERRVAERHVNEVRCLRTELHHNLGFEDSDLDTRVAAENWRRRACGTVLPQSAEQWRECYTRIVGDGEGFLGDVIRVVRSLEEREGEAARDVAEWVHRLERNWTASRFDPLVEDVKARLARDALNSVTFRNRHIGGWRRRLDVLEDGFDFDFEATRLIEKTLLEEDGVLLPITGRDVMEHCRIGPSPDVGRMLEEARRYFEVHKCTRGELLEHLGALAPGAKGSLGQ